MKLETLKTGSFGLGAAALIMSILMSSLMFAPSSASAFWWPWGNNHAHAQGSYGSDTVTVTVSKYVDGELATAESADNHAFPMAATWSDPEDGEGSGSYSLSDDNGYTAVTSEMNEGADYSTNEVLDGDVVAANCEEDHPYALVGYSTGDSMEAAASAEVTSDAPELSNLSDNMYVIVWNETCDAEPDPTPADGTIIGEVTGGQSADDPGELEVTSIDAQKTTAIANGEFEDGWQYLFNITVPSDEPNIAMKFADWMQTDGDHVLPVANNMRISSAQADNGGSAIVLTAANTYSSPDLTMTSDLNEDEDGLQVQVLVEVAVPSDTYNGTYSTEYGIRTLP